jgi:hypothetical protein
MPWYPDNQRKHMLKYIWDATIPTFANWNTPTRSKPLGKDIFTKLGDYLTSSYTAGFPVVGFSTLATGDYAWELRYTPIVTNWGSSYSTLPGDLLFIEIRYHNETLTGPAATVSPTTRPQRRNSKHAWYIAAQCRFTITADKFLGPRHSRSYRAHWNVDDNTLGNGPPNVSDYTVDSCPLPTLQCGGSCDYYRENSISRGSAVEAFNNTSTSTFPSAPPTEIIDAVNAVATDTINEILALTIEAAWRVAALHYGTSVSVPNYTWVRDGGQSPTFLYPKIGGPLC